LSQIRFFNVRKGFSSSGMGVKPAGRAKTYRDAILFAGRGDEPSGTEYYLPGEVMALAGWVVFLAGAGDPVAE
jgi:hypothetical protein